ncbi:MAG: hypothetical protein ACFFG0_06185 [Candidatus Thorarchaeota archaeon]
MEKNDNWFAKYKELESKISEKNEEIEALNEKIVKLKREITLEQSKKS